MFNEQSRGYYRMHGEKSHDDQYLVYIVKGTENKYAQKRMSS